MLNRTSVHFPTEQSQIPTPEVVEIDPTFSTVQYLLTCGGWWRQKLVDVPNLL